MKNLFEEHFKSGDWLKDLFDNAHDLIQIVHLDGTLVYVNQSWYTLLEYAPEEIQGKSLYSFIDEADHSRYIKYRNAIINGNTSNKEIIFSLKTKSGKTVSVEGVVSVKLLHGKPLYTRGIFRDITTRLDNEFQLKRLHEKLKEREYNLHQLLFHAPDAIVVIDTESRIAFWNPKAEEIFGWTAAEVINKPLSQTIIPVQYREAHAKGMQRYLTTGKAHVLNKTIEITALNKSGNEFFISLTISSTTQGGKPAFIAFIRDISKQKSNQLELERKTKELERSNASLQEFAYAASHDLKEPIRKILTFSERLRPQVQERLNEDGLRFFERMGNAARRMNLLVEDLLTYSHISQGAWLTEVTDLNQIVSVVLEDLELEIQEKSAHINVEPLPTIKGNKRQLQQFFQNLIGNALKYNKPGIPPEIHIRSQLVKGSEAPGPIAIEDREKPYYLLQISDNGIGFEQEDAERIFNVFTRLHGNTEYKGTGVGLSIVRKVVQNHNGFIWAESKPGEGATFNILLPAE